MKKSSYLKKIFIIGAVLLIMLSTLPVSLSSSSNFEKNQITSTSTTDHYVNSVVIIIGKCNIVQGPAIWLLGLYMPLIKRSFLIRATGEEGEQLNVIVRGDKFAAYIDSENIMVDINQAHGILFYGQKSILTNSFRIFARCKAENIWITTYD